MRFWIINGTVNQVIWFPYLPCTYTSTITLGKTYSSYTCLSFSSHKIEMILPHLTGMRSWSFWYCLLHIFQKTGSYITQILFHKRNMIQLPCVHLTVRMRKITVLPTALLDLFSCSISIWMKPQLLFSVNHINRWKV